VAAARVRRAFFRAEFNAAVVALKLAK